MIHLYRTDSAATGQLDERSYLLDEQAAARRLRRRLWTTILIQTAHVFEHSHNVDARLLC